MYLSIPHNIYFSLNNDSFHYIYIYILQSPLHPHTHFHQNDIELTPRMKHHMHYMANIVCIFACVCTKMRPYKYYKCCI